ncbi:MAG: branched-chain amino acid ABC transporter permease [Rhodospirillales bacterium]|nr:branched-chain amino acid ABC transporter permease [Rhodospirillales bacterium]
MSGYGEAILVMLAINIVVALAGYLPLAAGQLNLGIAGFMAVGGYTSAYLTSAYHLPMGVGMAAGAAAAGLLGLLVAVPVLRTSGIYLALATFALGQVIQAAFLNIEAVGAAAGYPVKPYAGFTVVLSVAFGVLVAVLLLSRTRFALLLTATKNDPLVTELFGVDVRAIRVAAFSLGALIAGIGGALYAHHYSYLEPQNFNIMLSVYIALYVLLGGTQTVAGPIVGAAFFTLLPELLRAGSHWRFVIFAVLIILVMAVRPEGLITGALARRLRFGKRREAAS